MSGEKTKSLVAEPCPRCGADISITPQEGGRGTRDLTVYVASCTAVECGYQITHLGSATGRISSAIREFNKAVCKQGASVSSRAKACKCDDGTYGVCEENGGVIYDEGFTRAQARAIALLESREVTPNDWEATRRILEKKGFKFDDAPPGSSTSSC